MCCKGFIKRVVPFFLTFAVGLFIASFFVTIAAPQFNLRNRGWGSKHQRYHLKMEFENQRLTEENNRLKRQLAEKDVQEDFLPSDLRYTVPPPPPLPPAPNAVPHRNR